MLEVLGFNPYGAINIKISGAFATVPDDPADRYRQMIAEWEAQGNTIPPYVTPPANPYSPLKPYQFWTAVRATGHEGDLHAWVDAMTNPIEKSYASAVLEFSLEFRYDHPLMDQAREILGLPVEEFQTLWLWALDL